jgi:peptide/nickel transport system permease protein
MIAFVGRRLLFLVPTLLGISLVVFLMVHLVPGDPAIVMLGERARPEALAELRTEMGLDKPLYVQYGRFLSELLRLDLGRSVKTHELVKVEIAQRFPATFELAVAAMILATVIGVLAGVASAARPRSWLDYTSMVGALVGVSMPIFWLGLMLILIFASLLHWLPISGRLPHDVSFPMRTHLFVVDAVLSGNPRNVVAALRHLILPALALGTIPMAVIARMTRSSLLEVMRQEYVRTARAKGLPEKSVIFTHALRNAIIPTITVIGLQFGYLLSGAIITETVFAWPGVGRWLLGAVLARDFRAIQGGVLVIAAIFVLVNLVVDMLYGFIDPRIRLAS